MVFGPLTTSLSDQGRNGASAVSLTWHEYQVSAACDVTELTPPLRVSPGMVGSGLQTVRPCWPRPSRGHRVWLWEQLIEIALTEEDSRMA